MLLSPSIFQLVFAQFSSLETLYSSHSVLRSKSFRFSAFGAFLRQILSSVHLWILALAVDCWDRIFRLYIRRYSPSIYWSFPRWKRCAQVLRFSIFGAFLVQGLSSLHLWIPALAFVCWDRIFRPSNFSSIFAIIRMRLLFSWPQNPAAESDFVLPTTDQEIQAALISFGADFKKMKGDVHAAVRADLLAGLKVASYASPRPFPAGCGSDHSPVVRSVQRQLLSWLPSLPHLSPTFAAVSDHVMPTND